MHPLTCHGFCAVTFVRSGRTRIGSLARVFALSVAACLAWTAQAGEVPLRQVIDAEVRALWEKEKITPAPKADDATFLRRVYLDLVGTIPTYDEARQFLDDTDAGKRDQLIARLLDDPRYAQHQAA